jgi:hypothetical protein
MQHINVWMWVVLPHGQTPQTLLNRTYVVLLSVVSSSVHRQERIGRDLLLTLMRPSSQKFTQKFHTLVSVAVLASLALSLCAPFVTFAQMEEIVVEARRPPRDLINPSDYPINPPDVQTSLNNIAAPESGAPDNGLYAPVDQPEKQIDWGCNLNPLNLSLAGCFTGLLYKVMYWTYSLSSWTGRFLNTTIYQLVVRMSDLAAAGTAGEAVKDAWSLVRDLANVALVFLMIFIGLSIIVGSTSYGSKRLLFKVVLAALFVNFSITLAQIVIDTSNLLALAVYEEFLVDAPQCATRSNNMPAICMGVGPSGEFMKVLDLQKIADVSTLPDKSGMTPAFHKTWQWIFALGSVMFLIMAFVFALTAVLIIVRFFTLVLLMVLSPIGLVAWITGVGGIGSRWWHKLLSQSFFLPLMFLMWLLGLRMLNGMATGLFNPTTSLTDALAAAGTNVVQSPSYYGIFIYFAFVVGVLLYSLKLSRDMGAVGANAVINTGNTWAKKAGMVVGAGVGGATVGMAARLGRNTAGRAAQDASESEHLKNMMSGNILQRNYARAALAGSKKLAGASFDARAIAGKDAQKWVGAGKKGGYSADQKAKQTKIKDEKEWLSKPTATEEEVYKRDKNIQKIEKDHSDILKGGYKGKNAVTNLQQDYDRALDAYTQAGPTDKAKEAELNRVEKELKAAQDYMNTDEQLQNLRLSSSALTPTGQAQIDAMEKTLAQNKQILDMRRARLGAETDSTYLENAKARGENRGDAYINSYSKRGYQRDFMAGLRKKTGKAARNEEMDKLFKKWKEEEEGATSSSPASPAPAPAPATTP